MILLVEFIINQVHLFNRLHSAVDCMRKKTFKSVVMNTSFCEGASWVTSFSANPEVSRRESSRRADADGFYGLRLRPCVISFDAFGNSNHVNFGKFFFFFKEKLCPGFDKLIQRLLANKNRLERKIGITECHKMISK